MKLTPAQRVQWRRIPLLDRALLRLALWLDKRTAPTKKRAEACPEVAARGTHWPLDPMASCEGCGVIMPGSPAPRAAPTTTWPTKLLARCGEQHGEDGHAVEQDVAAFGVWTHDDDMSLPAPAAIFADEADAAAWLKRCQEDPEDGRGTGDAAILPVAAHLFWNNCYCADHKRSQP